MMQSFFTIIFRLHSIMMHLFFGLYSDCVEIRKNESKVITYFSCLIHTLIVILFKNHAVH